MKNTNFWDVMPYSLVETYHLFPRNLFTTSNRINIHGQTIKFQDSVGKNRYALKEKKTVLLSFKVVSPDYNTLPHLSQSSTK